MRGFSGGILLALFIGLAAWVIFVQQPQTSHKLIPTGASPDPERHPQSGETLGAPITLQFYPWLPFPLRDPDAYASRAINLQLPS